MALLLAAGLPGGKNSTIFKSMLFASLLIRSKWWGPSTNWQVGTHKGTCQIKGTSLKPTSTMNLLAPHRCVYKTQYM